MVDCCCSVHYTCWSGFQEQAAAVEEASYRGELLEICLQRDTASVMMLRRRVRSMPYCSVTAGGSRGF